MTKHQILNCRRWVAVAALPAVIVFVGCHDDAKLPSPPPELQAVAKPPQTVDELKTRVDRAIAITGARVLNGDPEVGQSADQQHNKAWQVVHGLLPYGDKLQMSINGQIVPALEYIFSGKPLNGWRLYKAGKGLEAVMEPGSSISQGHPDQWIGYLSQCGVKLNDKLMVEVNGKLEEHEFRELIDQAMWKIRDGQEASWTLMALAAYPEYVPIQGSWKNELDEDWTIERIVRMEAEGGFEGGVACGGAHRLYALAEALQVYEKAGGELLPGSGWSLAQNVLDEAIYNAFSFQQPDGGFSTNKFERSGITADVDSRIDSTGHVLEVLAFALPMERLKSKDFERAVNYFCRKVEETKALPIGCGGLYHGANGLIIYRKRRWESTGTAAAETARRP